MRLRDLRMLSVILGMSLTASLSAEEVRYYSKDGVTYKETRRVVQQPVTQTTVQQQQQTVFREQYRTEMKDSCRTFYQPVTEYRWQSYLHGRWNPFVQPYWAYRLVPTTRWVAREEVVRMPVTQRELIPETRTVQVPVTTQRMVQKEIIERVAVTNPPNSGTQVAGASSRPIGGVARMESDPPRGSTTTGASGQRY